MTGQEIDRPWKKDDCVTTICRIPLERLAGCDGLPFKWDPEKRIISFDNRTTSEQVRADAFKDTQGVFYSEKSKGEYGSSQLTKGFDIAVKRRTGSTPNKTGSHGLNLKIIVSVPWDKILFSSLISAIKNFPVSEDSQLSKEPFDKLNRQPFWKSPEAISLVSDGENEIEAIHCENINSKDDKFKESSHSEDQEDFTGFNSEECSRSYANYIKQQTYLNYFTRESESSSDEQIIARRKIKSRAARKYKSLFHSSESDDFGMDQTSKVSENTTSSKKTGTRLYLPNKRHLKDSSSYSSSEDESSDSESCSNLRSEYNLRQRRMNKKLKDISSSSADESNQEFRSNLDNLKLKISLQQRNSKSSIYSSDSYTSSCEYEETSSESESKSTNANQIENKPSMENILESDLKLSDTSSDEGMELENDLVPNDGLEIISNEIKTLIGDSGFVDQIEDTEISEEPLINDYQTLSTDLINLTAQQIDESLAPDIDESVINPPLISPLTDSSNITPNQTISNSLHSTDYCSYDNLHHLLTPASSFSSLQYQSDKSSLNTPFSNSFTYYPKDENLGNDQNLANAKTEPNQPWQNIFAGSGQNPFNHSTDNKTMNPNNMLQSRFMMNGWLQKPLFPPDYLNYMQHYNPYLFFNNFGMFPPDLSFQNNFLYRMGQNSVQHGNIQNSTATNDSFEDHKNDTSKTKIFQSEKLLKQVKKQLKKLNASQSLRKNSNGFFPDGCNQNCDNKKKKKIRNAKTKM